MSVTNFLGNRVLSFFAVSLLGYSLCSFADDTEVYFADNSTIKPNVLFLLDVSGSMSSTAYCLNGASYCSVSADNPARISVLKNSIENIMADPNIKGLRVGIMIFPPATNRAPLVPVLDIDEVDSSRDMQKEDIGGGKARLTQTIYLKSDFGVQASANAKPNLGANYFSLASINYTGGMRFDNVLLHNPKDAEVSVDSIKASLELEVNSSYYQRWFNIYMEDKEKVLKDNKYIEQNVYDSRFLRNDLFQDLTNRKEASDTPSVRCLIGSYQTKVSCDVTSLIKRKIAETGWQDGNAITFLLTRETNVSTIFYSKYGYYKGPQLVIEADNKLIAESKITAREKLVEATLGLVASGGTPLVGSLLMASKYITADDVKPTKNVGPYHDNYAPSPIKEQCQLTHLVLMTDGQAGESSTAAASYIGQNYYSCKILTGSVNNDPLNPVTMIDEPRTSNSSERCGRALVSWMARVSHGTGTETYGNYVHTNTIGFALQQDRVAEKFLEDLAEYGEGKVYSASDTSGLTEAFHDVIVNAMDTTKPSAAGQVAISPQSSYEQRQEAFYSLFKVEGKDYWPGNVKGLKITYKQRTIDGDTDGEQAVLSSWYSNAIAIDPVKGTFNPVSTAWSDGLNDGNDVTKGGIVGQLPVNPAMRNLFTIKANSGSDAVQLNANANLTTADLGVQDVENAEARKKGLLDFIRGYSYQDGGSKILPETKKIGESANNGITLVSYGCSNGDNALNKNIIECPFDNLQAVGLIATNDGFVRGIDLRTGKMLYELMPKELLVNIDKLQKQKSLSREKIRTYGLDSQVVVYHDDTNEDGYIDQNEKAYAIVSAGRGGNYLYGIDISNQKAPYLAWTITNKTAGFEKLGKTWSKPAIGKIKVGDSATTVAIFGGGYDESQDTNPAKHADKVGNVIYVVDLASGKLLQAFSNNMHYSVPGAVALLTDEKDEFITDVFFGDMGGQLWRLKVKNGNDDGPILSGVAGNKGIVASISGNSKEDTRRFYQKPLIYKFKGEKLAKVISVNLGTGYKAHPLVKDNKDRFYSFRLPIDSNESSKVIEESDLSQANPLDMKTPLDMTYGFMVKLAVLSSPKAGAVKPEGEKVISNAFTDFDRLVFNTYIPDTEESKNSCVPNVGTQRSYFFNLITGASLLKTGFTEITPSTLPLDVTAYCGKKYCTIITGMEDLSGKKLSDIQFAKKPGLTTTVRKTGWTDLFDLSLPNIN